MSDKKVSRRGRAGGRYGAVERAGYGRETNYLRVYLSQLRRKLEVGLAHPHHLLIEPGQGYWFQLS